ncbi:MAG: protein-L-isoaspartate(D-aspartate) O-methyltransferase [Woeseiaceae bacterium]|nr:protein-L-isoaspartate(D-aspartate) O-methyltransferase [Woeseiaceae bacterium]
MAHAEPDFVAERDAMVGVVEQDVVATSRYTGVDQLDPKVREALRAVPRHLFIPERLHGFAYDNRPLPIGEGQTISQPYIVAMMTQLAALDDGDRVLEIGTGSGYQAAVLAEIAAQVYTIEIIDVLAERAAATLETLGYANVFVRAGDGYLGWPDRAPFDAILVTAAPETVPEPLIEQLAVGGRLVIPVGPEGRTQSLKVLQKNEDGDVTTRDVLPVRFVPFTRD